ncbi:SIR2 family protein [Burkholderia cenocepacia]|nr:SIR2 family protein [Burkholderia cenocepacia]RQV70157.1 SIR2 family protein [Burkholderia cenocepacia]
MSKSKRMKDDSTIQDVVEQIPNGVHLYRIREALESGHAAVMVGAGFSRNAEHGNRLPTWSLLMDALLADLYPSVDARRMAAERFGGISGMLRLAEEYAVARGRAQLDARLHQLLPDAGVINPGRLHTKLLSLPWADVYTTNYDTLLERALDQDRGEFIPEIKRRYQVVVAAQEVPFSKSNGRPRVVKLHGSLRSGSPLILTEEDYRCYPSRFAPFMNTVQQAMLENVFCLIGFSGDDPNFLQWTGWVRDRLGAQTPPIYLITVGAVPDGQRLILERRNIFPIPIEELGKKEGQIDYAQAFEKLFEFWTPPVAPRRALWPYDYPPTPKTMNFGSQELLAWARFSKSNREQYPGWLVAPERNRERISLWSGLPTTTMSYRKLASELSPTFRLVLLFEVTWILSVALEDVDELRAADIEQALEAKRTADSASGSVGGVEDKDFEPWGDEVEFIRGNLTVALMRSARQRGDIEKFNKWQCELESLPARARNPEMECQAFYEEVLFYIERLDPEQAMLSLKKLEVSAERADLYWRIRVGAIFGELGVIRRGREIVRNGLHQIREAIQAQGETLPLVSREHWAERVLDAMSAAVYAAEQESAGKAAMGPPPKRGKEQHTRTPDVTLHDLILREEVDSTRRESEETIYRDENARDHIEHPNMQLDRLSCEIERTAKVLEELTVKFDSRVVAENRWNVPLGRDAVLAARAYVRLTEEVGYVPAVGPVSLSGGHLVSSFRILSFVSPISACLRILTRANGGSVYTSLEPLTRAQVARLSEERAMQLYQLSIRGVNACMNRSSRDWDRRTETSIRFYLELASRLLLRLGSADADSAIQHAMGWHANEALRENTSLHRAFAIFFKRVVQLLEPVVLRKRSLDLLKLNPDSALLKRFRDWPTAVESLPYEVSDVSAEPGCAEAVDVVLDQSRQAEAEDEDAKAFHLERLDWLWRNGAMSADQERAFAEFVWRNIPHDALPSYAGFYRGAVLVWPSVPGVDVESLFRKWLIDEPFSNLVTHAQDLDGKPQQSIGSTSEALLGNILLTGNRLVRFAWSSNDASAMLAKLRAWWETEGRALTDKYAGKPNERFGAQIVVNRLTLIAHVVHRILVPNLSKTGANASDLSRWLAEMWSAGLRLGKTLVPLLFTGLSWWPEREDVVIQLTANAVRHGEDAQAVSFGFNAAGFWLLRLSLPTNGSRSYVAFLVEVLAWRRRPQTLLALEHIAELLRLGAVVHFQQQAHRLAAELLSLMSHFSDCEPGDDIVEFEYRPRMRQAAAVCLTALGRQFAHVRESETWKQAMTLVCTDALRDVRISGQPFVEEFEQL